MTDTSENPFRFLDKGDGIRWAIGAKDGLRGSTWRFWGNKKGDFYAAVRTMGGLFKTSLHRDRWCQTGLTQEFYKKAPHEPRRRPDRWQLPDEPWVTALEIVTPAEELELIESQEADPMAWLPAPKPGFISVVTIHIWQTGVPLNTGERWPGEARGTAPIGVIRTDMRSAVAVHGHFTLNDQTRRIFDRFRVEVKKNAPPEFAPGSGVRTIFVGNHANGVRFQAELRLKAD